MTFALGTFSDGTDTYAGLVIADRVHDLRSHLGDHITTLHLFQDWDQSLVRLHSIATLLEIDDGVSLADLRPLVPVHPRQIFCAGANYYRHTVEMTAALLANTRDDLSPEEIHQEALNTTERTARSGTPFVFAGISSALSGADDDIILWGPGTEHDWELEVAVVIGRTAREVSAGQALDYVAGYTICNDVSTRDVMFRPGFALTDFVTSKNRPSFFPIGPVIVPREFIPDYRRLRLRLAVNGEVMQDDTMEDMIYGVEELVSYLSNLTTLLPGDIILTGTPAGNAASHGNRWLRSGDRIESHIEGLGRQSNDCVSEPR